MNITSEPSASVIVPSYQGASRLPRLLGRLARQTVSAERFEIIVVIDGHVDDSVDVVNMAAHGGLPVRAIVLDRNRGRVTALNTGFKAANGDVLIRCDDDLAPGPDFVESHIARHRSSDRLIGVVGLTRDILAPSPYARAYGRRRSQAALTSSYHGDLPTWRHWAANCSLLRETWEEVGHYDISYRHYGWEDVDYGYRLHSAGFEVVIAPELETPHYGAATSTLSRAMRAYHSGAARKTFSSLHPDTLPVLIPGNGPWGRLVGMTAHLGSEARFQALATLTDRLLPMLPQRFGEKLVALSVESAVLAGYEHAEAVSAQF